MQQKGVPGRRAPRPAPTAAERGWDDSMYPDHDQARIARRNAGDAGRTGREGGGSATGTAPSGTDDPYGVGYQDGCDDGHHDGTGEEPPKKKRRFLRWFVLILAVLILGTAGAGYLYYQHLNGNLGKDSLNLGDNKLDRSDPNAAGQTPLNILLLGSDSRESDENVELGGSKGDRDRPPLADVQMLVHVSADRSNMSVVSIPRDTKATIPRCTDPKSDDVFRETTDKINTSLQHGGPGCTVATWEELTGVPIDHFMMIDFAGVVSMADAVGGVPVCVDNNVNDPQSKLRLTKGNSTIKGEQALSWLRTRHGFGDGTDIGRAKAQHMYMSAMVRQLKAGTKLTDPGKLRALAEAATEALTVDDGLGSVKKLYDLGNDLKRVPTKRITMATMPWQYGPNGYVLPKPGDADRVFSLVRNDVALDGKDKKDGRKKPAATASPDPIPSSSPKAEIPVRVMNGTGTALQAPVTGRAGVIAGVLAGKGYSQAVADRTPKSQADTTISYSTEDDKGNALAAAKSLGVPERLVKHSSAVQGITLVIGTDWREGNVYPKDTRPGDDTGGDDEKEQEAPDSADALQGDDEDQCMNVNPNYVT